MEKKVISKKVKNEILTIESDQFGVLLSKIYDMGYHDSETKKENQTDAIRTHFKKINLSFEHIESLVAFYNDGYELFISSTAK